MTEDPKPPMTSPVIDPSVFDAIAGQCRQVGKKVSEITELFRITSTQQVREIIHASSAGDRSACARYAHLLRGGSASIGAARLKGVCAWIEEYCMSPVTPETTPVLPGPIIESLHNEQASALHALEEAAMTWDSDSMRKG